MSRALANGLCRRRRIGGDRCRCLSLHSGPDNLEELLEKHVVAGGSKKPASEEEGQRRLTSTRREVLALYREILRATRLFLWPNEQGVLWRDVLRTSTRKEFEEARFEQDPEIIARLLVGGRDALQQAVDKAVNKQTEAINKPPDGPDRWCLINGRLQDGHQWVVVSGMSSIAVVQPKKDIRKPTLRKRTY